MVSNTSLSKYMQKLLFCCVSTGISVNCTFDDNYLCGYNASGFIWSYGASNSQAQSSLPWTDHTIGHYPGKNSLVVDSLRDVSLLIINILAYSKTCL